MGSYAVTQTFNKHLTVGAAALFLSIAGSTCDAYCAPAPGSGCVRRLDSRFGHRTHIATNFDSTLSRSGVRHRDDTRSSGSELRLAPPEALADLWTSYNEALEAAPLITKSVTAGIILGSADLAGQALEVAIAKKDGEGEEGGSASVDVARFIRFAIFGLVLQAPWNHFYYQVLDGALPPTENPYTATTAIKVVIDQFVQAPVFTVLIFGFLGLLEGKSVDMIRKQLDDDYVDTMLANWKLWVPATMVNIAFCPPVLRVLFLNCVFFFWSIFLSLKLNKGEAE